MEYVFGPVPSRRLGQSLGIDPVPLKTCNWNCVYCQLGRSTPLITKRAEYVPVQDVMEQLKKALQMQKPDEIDWITFVGSGETTLHAGIGDMIRKVKTLTDIPVAVITNGSLLYLSEVRDELLPADAVLPSIDAGSAGLYRKINRPHPHLEYETFINGLVDFRQQYHGKLWIEVMLVKGLNDSIQALQELNEKLLQVKPDEIHLLLPTRPPAETWVEPAEDAGIYLAQLILGVHTKVFHPVNGLFDLRGADSVFQAVLAIITRHPMKESQLLDALGHFSQEEIDKTMTMLKESGKAQAVERFGECYWSASSAHYASTGTENK